MYPYVENPRRERFHWISKIPNSCRMKLSRDFARHRTQHKGRAKSPETVTTRFIISKLIYSMNSYDKLNKEILYNNCATLFCVCWGKGKCCC